MIVTSEGEGKNGKDAKSGQGWLQLQCLRKQQSGCSSPLKVDVMSWP